MAQIDTRSNSEKHPEAWKIFDNCARYFMMNPPEMQYGIPDPTYDHGTNPAGTQLIAGIGYRINREAPGPEYIWSKDPGILFCKFAIAFYSDESRIDNEGELIRLRASLYHLEEKNK